MAEVRFTRQGRALLVLGFLCAASAPGQFVSDLEPERPISIEDARPVTYRAVAGSVDWTYNLRERRLNDYGPGFSLLYGAARGLEVGAGLRYVTRPGRNSLRGVSSGDLLLHALYGVKTETTGWPGLALRVGVQLPTGFDSKGMDLQVVGLLTRSFEAFRLHGNLRWTRLGDTNSSERRERFEGIASVDFSASRRGLTDSLLLADLSVRSNPVLGSNAIVTVEFGTRQRIGMHTLIFLGAGSEITGESDRARLRLRVGLTHIH